MAGGRLSRTRRQDDARWGVGSPIHSLAKTAPATSLTLEQDRRFAGIAARRPFLLGPAAGSRDPGHWAVGHRCLDDAHGRAANTHLTTVVIAGRLADEIGREERLA